MIKRQLHLQEINIHTGGVRKNKSNIYLALKNALIDP